MAPTKQRHWAQWVWLAAGLGVAVRVAYIFWGQGDPAVPPPPAQSHPRVTIVAGNGGAVGPLVAEQMELFDQQPLSMPTRWNAGSQPLPAELRRQPGEVFGMYDVRLAFAAEKLEPVFGPRAVAPKESLGALVTIGPLVEGWVGLGRVDRPVAKLPERDAAIEVRRFGVGREPVVLAESLRSLDPAVATHDWGPMEFTVVVAPAGLVGVPTLTTGSGVEQVDAFFANFLARDFRLGERLPPGFYRVCLVR
ncbi:MAG: hypothetical protein QM691_08925 [Opitutaceae bacterium]